MSHAIHSISHSFIPSKLLFGVLLLLSSFNLFATEDRAWNEEQLEVIKVMEQLSATTAQDGAGADAYGALLADDFGRWTVGSELINGKKEWVDGIRGWFNDGWRVEDRENSVLEVIVEGKYAFTRRTVDESYVGPDDERSQSSAALAEIWVKRDDRWLLQQVNVHPES